MPDTIPKTYTEGDHFALVDAAVTRETASLTTVKAELETEKAGLQTRVDALETEKAAAVQRAETAEKDLADYKTTVEAEKAREAQRETRLAAVTAANPFLDVSGKDEASKERVERIVAFADEAFATYIADMTAVAESVKATGATAPVGTVPTETAALAPTGTTTPTKATGAGLFAAARGLGATAQNGA